MSKWGPVYVISIAKLINFYGNLVMSTQGAKKALDERNAPLAKNPAIPSKTLEASITTNELQLHNIESFINTRGIELTKEEAESLLGDVFDFALKSAIKKDNRIYL